jgi:hypothetical protein
MNVSIPTRREMLAWALAIILAVSVVVVSRSDNAGAGVNGPSTEVVYIATGANFPDALGAAATAALGLGPVLLVQLDSIPTATMNELTRLQPSRIVITGGTAVVSAGVEAELNDLAWNPDVERIGGANRYETAALLSGDVFPTSGMYPRVAHARGLEASVLGAPAPSPAASILSVDITAPAAGTLIINAGVDLLPQPGETDTFDCRIELDDDDVPGSFRAGLMAGSVADDDTDGACQTEVAIDVAAGAYTVDFLLRAGSANMRDRTLIVQWVPFNGAGAIPTP